MSDTPRRVSFTTCNVRGNGRADLVITDLRYLAPPPMLAKPEAGGKSGGAGVKQVDMRMLLEHTQPGRVQVGACVYNVPDARAFADSQVRGSDCCQ